MAGKVGQGAQIINFNYGLDLLSEYANYILKHIIENTGVIEANVIVTNPSEGKVKIGAGSSFIISPFNKTDYVIKIDLTEDTSEIILSDSEPYLVLRYEWQDDENATAEFLAVATTYATDVIIGKGNFETGNLVMEYDEQRKVSFNPSISGSGGDSSNCEVVEDSNAQTVQGYAPGTSEGMIPLKDTTSLNNNLNAQYLGDGSIKMEPSTNAGDYLSLQGDTKNDGLNVMYIAENESNFISLSEVAINDGTLQNNLNAEMIDGKTIDYFALSTHKHNYDQLVDGTTYIRMQSADVDSEHKIKPSGITDESLVMKKLEYPFIRNNDTGEEFVPFIQYDVKVSTANGHTGDLQDDGETYAVPYIETPIPFLDPVEPDYSHISATKIQYLSKRSWWICSDNYIYSKKGNPWVRLILFGKIAEE